MATKKFIIEVEEGKTKCNECPFDYIKCARENLVEIDCTNFNLATMKITEYDDNEGQALLYAVGKTAERTKKEVFLKVADWLGKNLYKYAENIRITRLINDLKQVIEYD